MAFLLLFKLETSCSACFIKDRDVRAQICLCLPKTPVGTHWLQLHLHPLPACSTGGNDGEERAGGVGRDLLPHFLISAFLNYSEEPFGASLVAFGEMQHQEAWW